jgi:thiamine pyrophosphokinase
MQNILKGIFGKRKDEEFVALMQAALEDQTIRQHMALPQPQRLIQLQKWGQELAEEHAPQPLISAIGFLEDDDIASQALQLLRK